MSDLHPDADAADTGLRRVGLFGGAFDPPHLAHQAVARAALTQLRLDRLHIVPTGDAWHKPRALSAAADRLAMCQLAFADIAGVCVDARELRRAGPTYTIDTLAELRAQYPQAELFLQIGSDQAAAFHTWRHAAEIGQLATIVIAARSDARAAATQTGFASARTLKLPPMPHSATAVRQRVAARQPLDDLLPAAVARYIADHHLYQTNR
ncbi:MAG: nicotinate (nicotinamide) nucleotide adenylyltransferase [Burkholderiaceae bacterium]|nr:nicotinate (nicotinamide) nucleotide adenylyltransferase [Burkholderiaceae bacterium]